MAVWRQVALFVGTKQSLDPYLNYLVPRIHAFVSED